MYSSCEQATAHFRAPANPKRPALCKGCPQGEVCIMWVYTVGGVVGGGMEWVVVGVGEGGRI